MNETLGTETQIQFETAAALVNGVELTANGHKLAWSIGDYLVSLEKRIGEVVQAKHATNQ